MLINGIKLGRSVVHKISSVVMVYIKWVSMGENLSSGCFEQQGRRQACSSMQSDLRLCFSLFAKYHIQACHRQKFNFLASLCS